MARQLDEMRNYIRLAIAKPADEDILLTEDIQNIDFGRNDNFLLEDLNDVVFKLRSYQENQGSAEYVQGVEEGLALAADMVRRIIERYSEK